MTIEFTSSFLAQMNIVSTKFGQVEGVILESNIACFKGIPYAQPPVGELRWRRPQPPQN